MRSTYLYALLVSVGVFVIDRLTKYVVCCNLQLEDFAFSNHITFSLSYNTGIAWSLFAGGGKVVLGIIMAATLFLLFHIVMHAYERISARESIIGEVLVVAGGLSNLCDRLVYPGVVDFIKIEIMGFIFPIFNIADVSVCVGIILIVYYHFLND